MLERLQKIPCITALSGENQPLWYLCLTDIWCPASLAEWKSEVDAGRRGNVRQTIFVNLPEADRRELTEIFRFPTIDLPDLPPIESVNLALARHFKALCQGASDILRQSRIAQIVTDRIAGELPDRVIFLVLDGLSFYDAARWRFPATWRIKHEPCLVDGLSVTTSGMRRLIGAPPLAHRLFELGYKHRLGFSYWERSQNQLTDDLFAEFPPTQLFRVTTFAEVLDQLEAMAPTHRTFIQIVRMGVDSICHNHREKPNIDTRLDQLEKDIEAIVEVLSHSRRTLRLFVTADHGILWFKDQNVAPFHTKSASPRYTERESVASGLPILTIQEEERRFTVLTGDAVISRNRKTTEWGFHGGVSAQESLVPFLDIIPR